MALAYHKTNPIVYTGSNTGETPMATLLEYGGPIVRLLGFVLKRIKPGHAIFAMQVDERHHNPMGTLRGGVYCDLADAAMGFAYASTLGEGESFTTVELKINFLRGGAKDDTHGRGQCPWAWATSQLTAAWGQHFAPIVPPPACFAK
jgi:uncharacterized protein (TIGR00369 family)